MVRSDHYLQCNSHWSVGAQSQQNLRNLKKEQCALTRAGTSCFTSCSDEVLAM